MAYQNTGTIGPEDGDALISLNGDHGATAAYVQRLRTVLPQRISGVTFSFLPADIVSQILNFGLPAPIDLQVIGNDQHANYAYATELLRRMRTVPGVADARIQQVLKTTRNSMSMSIARSPVRWDSHNVTSPTVCW